MFGWTSHTNVYVAGRQRGHLVVDFACGPVTMSPLNSARAARVLDLDVVRDGFLVVEVDRERRHRQGAVTVGCSNAMPEARRSRRRPPAPRDVAGDGAVDAARRGRRGRPLGAPTARPSPRRRPRRPTPAGGDAVGAAVGPARGGVAAGGARTGDGGQRAGRTAGDAWETSGQSIGCPVERRDLAPNPRRRARRRTRLRRGRRPRASSGPAGWPPPPPPRAPTRRAWRGCCRRGRRPSSG